MWQKTSALKLSFRTVLPVCWVKCTVTFRTVMPVCWVKCTVTFRTVLPVCWVKCTVTFHTVLPVCWVKCTIIRNNKSFTKLSGFSALLQNSSLTSSLYVVLNYKGLELSLHTKCYSGDLMKKSETDGTCDICETGEVHTGFWWGHPMEGYHLEDLGLDGRII
jgi:hypothetical protein